MFLWYQTDRLLQFPRSLKFKTNSSPYTQDYSNTQEKVLIVCSTLAKWLSVRLWTKWLWVWVQLQKVLSSRIFEKHLNFVVDQA